MFQALALIVDRSDHKNFFLISLSILIKRSLEKLWIPQGEVTCYRNFVPSSHPFRCETFTMGKQQESDFFSQRNSQLVIETKFVYSLIDMHLKVTFQDL